MRDPYAVLGVAKTASEADVKQAYRKLAKTWHPDQKPNDPTAKEKFSEIGSAYELLSDKAKRAQYDRGEIDAEGKPRFQGFPGGSAGGPWGPRSGGGGRGQRFDFEYGMGGAGRGGRKRQQAGVDEDMIDEILGAFGGRRGRAESAFGGGEPGKGEDLRAEITVAFRDWARGAKPRVRLPNGRELEVSVPAGIEDGKTIRLRGQGAPSDFGGEPGDVLIVVHVGKDATFRADGNDIRVEVPITLYDAVLGGKVRVPTLDGEVEMKAPPGSDGAKTLRLRGKGVQAKSGPGDLLVELRIALPKGGDPGLTEYAEEMREQGPYDPQR